MMDALAIEAALLANIGTNTHLADDLCMAINHVTGELTEEQVESLLAKLKTRFGTRGHEQPVSNGNCLGLHGDVMHGACAVRSCGLVGASLDLASVLPLLV